MFPFSMRTTICLAIAFSALASAVDNFKYTGSIYTDSGCGDAKPLVVHHTEGDYEARCQPLNSTYLSFQGNTNNPEWCHVYFFTDDKCEQEFPTASRPALNDTCTKLDHHAKAFMAGCWR